MQSVRKYLLITRITKQGDNALKRVCLSVLSSLFLRLNHLTYDLDICQVDKQPLLKKCNVFVYVSVISGFVQIIIMMQSAFNVNLI